MVSKVVRMCDVKSPEQRTVEAFAEITDSQGNLRSNKRIQDVFPKDIWKGKRCFIIGGGPSLKGFDFNQFKGELVITVNRGLEACPFSAMNVCTDARVWGWYESSKDLGPEATEKFRSYKGYKVWLNVQAFPFPEDIYTINPLAPTDFTFQEYYRGIPIYGNSGVNAIMMAACLGANPIYLLGFDLYGVDGHLANYHSGYPENMGQSEELYKVFQDDFHAASLQLNNHTKVINLNPKSNLKYFEFGNFKDIPKIKRPIIVSFYTDEYEEAAKFMEHSAIKFGLETDIVPIKKEGSWLKIIYSRANFIKDMLLKYKKPILWLDSDALIIHYPELFDNLDADFAVHFLKTAEIYGGGYPYEKELLGGTMFFNYTPKALELVDRWIEDNAKHPNMHLSQWVLQETIKNWDGKLLELPPSYTQIFDTMARYGEPMIEHYVFSRKTRHD